MELKLMMLVSLLAFGFATSASAGAVADADVDGVPDAFDNCLNVANGPDAGACSAQENTGTNAFGDACNGDFDNDSLVTGTDFGPWFAAFTAGVPSLGPEDMDCDGLVTGTDFGPWFAQFTAGAPGP
jgi:hypothetical protein